MKTSNKIAIALVLLSVGVLYASVEALVGHVETSTQITQELTGSFKHIVIVGGNIVTESGQPKRQAKVELRDGTESKVLSPQIINYAIERKAILNDTLFVEFKSDHNLKGIPDFNDGVYELYPDILIESGNVKSVTLVDSKIEYKAKYQQNLEFHSFGNSFIEFEMAQQKMDSLSLYLEGTTQFYPGFHNMKQEMESVNIKNLKVVAKDFVRVNLNGFDCEQIHLDLEDGVGVNATQKLLGIGK